VVCKFLLQFAWSKKAGGWILKSELCEFYHQNCTGSTQVKGVVLALKLKGVSTRDGGKISNENMQDALALRKISGANSTTARRVLKAGAQEDLKLLRDGFYKTAGWIQAFVAANFGSSAILVCRDNETDEVRLLCVCMCLSVCVLRMFVSVCFNLCLHIVVCVCLY
jgi:hypothetical protein